MPIIVDEVVISVEVGSQATGDSSPAPTTTSQQHQQAIIAECVERVLDVLMRKQER